MPNKAVFTVVKNESVFLPLWMKYYSRYFEDIFILNDGTTDRSLENINYPVVNLDQNTKFATDGHSNIYQPWICQQVSEFQKELFRSYDIVLFCEVDEIVVPKKTFEGHLSANPGGRCVKCNGYEVVQQKTEPAIDWQKPVLEQRKFWKKMASYDKPLLSSVPIVWTRPGFHTCKNESQKDPELFLIHLRRIDRSVAYRRFFANHKKGDTNFEKFFWCKPTGEIPQRLKVI